MLARRLARLRGPHPPGRGARTGLLLADSQHRPFSRATAPAFVRNKAIRRQPLNKKKKTHPREPRKEHEQRQKGRLRSCSLPGSLSQPPPYRSVFQNSTLAGRFPGKCNPQPALTGLAGSAPYESTWSKRQSSTFPALSGHEPAPLRAENRSQLGCRLTREARLT